MSNLKPDCQRRVSTNQIYHYLSEDRARATSSGIRIPGYPEVYYRVFPLDSVHAITYSPQKAQNYLHFPLSCRPLAFAIFVSDSLC